MQNPPAKQTHPDSDTTRKLRVKSILVRAERVYKYDAFEDVLQSFANEATVLNLTVGYRSLCPLSANATWRVSMARAHSRCSGFSGILSSLLGTEKRPYRNSVRSMTPT